MARHSSIIRQLDADLARSLDRWQRQRKADEAAEDEAATGAQVERIERNWTGDVVEVVLANGCTLRPRSNDSGESWIEIERP